MTFIPMPPEQDEDRGHDDRRQRQLDDEAEQRAHEKLTIVAERFYQPTAEVDPARSAIFGALCGIALIIWAGFAVARMFL